MRTSAGSSLHIVLARPAERFSLQLGLVERYENVEQLVLGLLPLIRAQERDFGPGSGAGLQRADAVAQGGVAEFRFCESERSECMELWGRQLLVL